MMLIVSFARRKGKKMSTRKIRELKEAIRIFTKPDMTRMEAWRAVTGAGVNVQWEAFKRAWNRELFGKSKKGESK